MPVATVDSNAWDRRDLKSLEGAYIMVRPLPYGMVLERRDKATRMFMESETGSAKNKKRDEGNVSRMEVEMLNEFSTLYDFRYCIGEHNLTDAKEQLLDLGTKMAIKSLNPKVGEEIAGILDEINKLDEEFDDEDFTKLPESFSTDPSEPLALVDQSLEN